ncbi:PhzF family phenazine biosynthesis protein [Pseudochryseolinea flava]|uniref:Phenazine biosynthesis protein PhzF n=1 Tax=Pseudochryseolinea flava TaxID=2059302 RepID=A0A364XTN6_9BACT|nr:PhzF family phenazine biosynthesis protein [Pseudochryseolinea flava]RAV97723.1 phenazine biosynthesis protein PhzF [Pseudochryseolinea flava]
MKTYFVDSFTNKVFKGNPAGVCLLTESLSEIQMLNVAKEIGFSETAFVKSLTKENRYSIRFFSPKQEIPLCGHATLAAAKILFTTTDATTATFENVNGVALTVTKSGQQLAMRFPIYETKPTSVPSTMLEALGLQSVVASSYCENTKMIILEIDSAKTLLNLQPDFGALVKSYEGADGVLVTAASDNADFDFHYRYFWPWAGTNEDPVTGVVHTFLTKYWSQRLHKKTLKAFQSSERTGFMTAELHDDHVMIYGTAVIVLEGTFLSY